MTLTMKLERIDNLTGIDRNIIEDRYDLDGKPIVATDTRSEIPLRTIRIKNRTLKSVVKFALKYAALLSMFASCISIIIGSINLARLLGKLSAK